jgi:outer membrane scaffolding protein for murein synthesis (MipA/OmpV family)
MGFNIGPIFADHGYHNYYYGVGAKYVTAERPYYRAESGYSGTALVGSLTKRFNYYWIGGFIRNDNLDGAVFETSPLVATEHAFMAGFGIAWIFKRSERTVDMFDR